MEDFQALIEHQLQDLYSAETQLVDALQELADEVTSEKFRTAILSHLEQTREHVTRLEEVAEEAGLEVDGEECKGMAGLVEEATGILEDMDQSILRDSMLIGAVQRVEHYEIAAYGTLIEHFKLMKMNDAAKKLHKTLKEEEEADVLLTKIAESSVNPDAMKESAAASA